MDSKQLTELVLRQRSLFEAMRIVLSHLATEQDLWRSRTRPVVAGQLRCQGRTHSDGYRYEVTIEIEEGRKRPASDVDYYAKRTMDTITQSGLLWMDDDRSTK